MDRISVLMAVLVCSMGCQPAAPTLSQEERAEIADSLTQLAQRLAETWNAGEEEAYLDCYLADSTFTFAAGGTLIRGWQAFADTVRILRAALTQSTVTYDRMYVDVLSRDLGVVTATFGWSSVDTAGAQMRLQGTNIAVGVARGYRADEGERVMVTEATPFQVMSASKPLVAFAIAILEDRGLVDVARAVSFYVPEFGREGKGEITVHDVLTHRSGVVVPQLWDSPAIWPDWDRVQEEIWKAPPRYCRGILAYHPYEFGWILGEVVRRVTGQPLDRFLDGVIPKSLKNLRLRRDDSDETLVAHSYWLGPKRLRLGGQDVAAGFEERNNSRQTLTSLVPGASMTTTASTIARFYEMLLAGGTMADGTRLLRPSTLERYLTANVKGFDRTLRSYLVLGRGFQLGWRWPHPYGWWDSRACVGHGGGFCVVVFGDRRTEAAIAMITNGNKGLGDVFRRFAPLSSAIRRAVSSSTAPAAQARI